MAAFSISRDHLNVLRLRRRVYPALTLDEQETFELSGAVYGFLVRRNECLTAPEFLDRIRSTFDSNDVRQAEIERVIELCFDHPVHQTSPACVPLTEVSTAVPR